MDRIDRNDGGKQRCVAAGAPGHKVAGRNAPVADAAIHRRAQFGKFHIEFGLTHGGLVIAHRGLGVAEGLRALLEGLVGDGLVAHQLLRRAYRSDSVKARLDCACTRLARA